MDRRSMRCTARPEPAWGGALWVVCLALAPGVSWGDAIDLTEGWRIRPDADQVGAQEHWGAPEYADADWAVIGAGKSWEDQGFPGVDGYVWLRRAVEVPAEWAGLPVWLVLGNLDDAGDIYCNGHHVNTYGERGTRSTGRSVIIAELTGLLDCGQRNVIAIHVLDWWPEGGGLSQPPCLLTNDATQLLADSVFGCYANSGTGRLAVCADLSGLGNERPPSQLRVAVRSAGQERVLAEGIMPLTADVFEQRIEVVVPHARAGAVYEVEARASDAAGRAFQGLIASERVTWPGAPNGTSGCPILNNFVTQLLETRPIVRGKTDMKFENPRDGWVFVSVSDCAAPEATLGGAPLVWRTNPDTGALEAMRRLPRGPHGLALADVQGGRVAVRAVPEIAFCYYPSDRHVQAYPPYDWAYVERHVLPHVNALVSRNDVACGELEQWGREGRVWIANAPLPGVSDAAPPAADAVYAAFASNAVVTMPGYAGLMVDEFMRRSEGHYAAWSEAVERLIQAPEFLGKTFYGWCTDLYDLPHARAFCRMLLDRGHVLSWERYLSETATPEEARDHLCEIIGRPLEKWRCALPGVERQMVMCLGYMSAPPESLNTNPGVDYHVFLDMQFHYLATDPIFQGLYGIMEYMAAYADEESLRYAHKLFRHYCIEGRRGRFNSDPYILPHLTNPDFADGLDGWRVEPAEPGSIEARRIERFSWLQGRYPQTSEGDQFCRMKRSPIRANRVSQTIRALDPTRLYSVKVVSADIGRLDQRQTLALRVSVGNAQLLDEYAFQYVYPSSYAHEAAGYNEDHPAFFNLHRLVFRPQGPTAELVVQDWAGGAAPGGPEGQEIAFNFVEVQPFHAP